MIFFLGDFYEFSRETNESITKGLRIVTKWITFDSLAYIRESYPLTRSPWKKRIVEFTGRNNRNCVLFKITWF